MTIETVGLGLMAASAGLCVAGLMLWRKQQKRTYTDRFTAEDINNIIKKA